MESDRALPDLRLVVEWVGSEFHGQRGRFDRDRRRISDLVQAGWDVIEASHTDRQSTLLVRTDTPVMDPAWTVDQVDLEDLVLAYMAQAPGSAPGYRRAQEAQQ